MLHNTPDFIYTKIWYTKEKQNLPSFVCVLGSSCSLWAGGDSNLLGLTIRLCIAILCSLPTELDKV